MTASIGKRRSLVLLALTTAVLAAAALVLDHFHVPLDLTARGSYSLSSVSRNLYKSLDDKLLITYYVSPDLVARHPGPRQVEDYLRKFEGQGRGKITVEVADPKSNAGALESLGIQPQRMQVIVDNEARIATVYSGVVVQYRGRSESLPFVLGIEGLEYGVVKAVYRAVSGKPQVAAVLVGDADKSYAQDYRALDESLRAAGWKVRALNSGEEVPAEAGVLIVLGNADLDDYAAYRIDAWLAGGGATFMAVRGVGIDTKQGLAAAPLAQGALIGNLSKYGVKVRKELVLDVSARSLPFQDQTASGGQNIRYVRYPHWIVIRAEDCDPKSPLTANFPGLDLMWPSPLELSPPVGVVALPLVRSTSNAWLQTKDFAVAPEDEGRYTQEAPATTGQYILAASLEGRLPMAYAGKALPARGGAAALPPLPREAKASRLIVVGSADFATDLMSLTDSLFNASFAANAVELVSWGEELAALKARGSRDPRLVKIKDPRRKATLELFIIGLNLAIIPGAFALFGIVRSRRRKAAASMGGTGMGEANGGGAANGGTAPVPNDTKGASS